MNSDLLLQYRFSEDTPWKYAILRNREKLCYYSPELNVTIFDENIQINKAFGRYFHIYLKTTHDKIFIKVLTTDIEAICVQNQNLKQVKIDFPPIPNASNRFIKFYRYRAISLVHNLLKKYNLDTTSLIKIYHLDNVKVKGNNDSEELNINLYC